MKTLIFTIIGLFALSASVTAQAGDDWGFSISISNGHVSAGHYYNHSTPSHRHWHGTAGHYTSCDRHSCHEIRVIPRTVTYYRPPAPVIVLPRPPFCPPVVVSPPVRYSRPVYHHSSRYSHYQPRSRDRSPSNGHSRKRH
ncbi:MAG: hypothetical protein RRC34_00610 [Lentisphaeria bacterium]|nr:hypothetical protein [Lentisphaeria bacterium]